MFDTDVAFTLGFAKDVVRFSLFCISFWPWRDLRSIGFRLVLDNALNVFDVSCCVYVGQNFWGDFLDTLGGIVTWGTAIRMIHWGDYRVLL